MGWGHQSQCLQTKVRLGADLKMMEETDRIPGTHRLCFLSFPPSLLCDDKTQALAAGSFASSPGELRLSLKAACVSVSQVASYVGFCELLSGGNASLNLKNIRKGVL